MSDPLEVGSTMHQVLEKLVDEAVADERDRCATLMDIRAEITENSARKLRLDGTFNAGVLTWRWPFVKTIPVVAYNWEKAARDLDAFARAMRQMASYIRSGLDPRKPEDLIG